jgi:tetratricopeptide (TPR) repeat protein
MKRNGLSGRRLAAAALALTLAAGACASATDRLQQGMELEQRGRPVDAARRYIDALKKDASLADARVRLQETGDRAVRDYLAEAAATEARGHSGSAANVLFQLDELRRDASAVGVTLAVPADYAAQRRAMMDRAVEQSIRVAAQSAGRRDYNDAIGLLDQAQRWQPTPEQRARLNEARFDAHLAWAEDDAAAGRYRSAFDRAGRAAGVLGRDAAAAIRALELQQEVLRRGTVRVAVLPVMADDSAEARLPAGFMGDVQNELERSHWMRAPQFVEVVDPRDVREELRRRRPPFGGLGTRNAAMIGRALDAEVAVLLTVDSVARTETVSSAVRRAARTTAGVDTAFTVNEGRRETWARINYVMVDVATAQVLDRGTVQAEGGARYRAAKFAGDWRTLALSREDRELFLRNVRDADEQEIRRDLVGGLAPRLGREVFDTVLRRID